MAEIKPPSVKNISSPKRSNNSSKKTLDATSKSNLGDTKPLQFKIPVNLHQEIKMYAVERGMTMTELFLTMYDEHKTNH